MAPLCHIITYVALAVHPPWPVLVVFNIVSGFGNGLCDAAFCAWVGGMDKANTVQGFMHSCYSIGALFAPLIATSMVVSAELPWYTYYYVMVRVILRSLESSLNEELTFVQIGMSVVEWIGLVIFFWRKTGATYREEHKAELEDSGGAGTREALKSKVTWLCALFFFAYMGVEGRQFSRLILFCGIHLLMCRI